MLDTVARRNKISEIARQVIDQNPLFLDTETTGLGRSDEIIEIALVDTPGTIVFESLVRPSQPIPPEASAIHHITNQMVEKSPAWSIIWSMVRPHLTGKLVVIYNADFDLRLIQQSHARFRIPWKDHIDAFDLLKVYAEYWGDWNYFRRSYRYISLDQAGKQCGIPLFNRHRAADDASLARAVLFYLASASAA